MKKIFLLTGLSLFTFAFCLSGEVQAQFQQIKPKIDNTPVATPKESYQEYLMRAVAIHNLQFRLNNLINITYPTLKEYLNKYDLTQEQIASIDECSTRLLEPYFSEPHNDTKTVDAQTGATEYLLDGKLHQVYNKLLDEYERRLGRLTVSLNESGNADDDDDSADAYPYWRVAKEVLEDFYNNQGNYGLKKEPFPLWEDQKYLYTQRVLGIANTVKNKFWIHDTKDQTFNNGLTGKINELIDPNTSYAYMSYSTLTQKFNNLLDYVKKHSNYDNLKSGLPSAASLPRAPEKRIPPFYEIIQLKDDPAVTGTLFPEWPAPWAEYISQKFANGRAPNGEMDKVFMPNSVVLRPEARGWDLTKINNRLSLRRELVNFKEDIFNAYLSVLSAVEETLADVKEGVQKLGIRAEEYEEKIPLELNQDESFMPEVGEKILRTYLQYRDALMVEKKTAIGKAQMLYRQQTKDSNPNNTSVDNSLSSMAQASPDSSEYAAMANMMNAAQTADDEKYMNDLFTDIEGLSIQAPMVTNDVEKNIRNVNAQIALQREAYENSKKELDELWNRHIDMSTCINSGVMDPSHRGKYTKED